MTGSQLKQFGDAIAARWQNTGYPAIERAWDLCKGFDLDLVILAMDLLKSRMLPGLLIMDPDWLLRCAKECGKGATVFSTPADRVEKARQESIVRHVERDRLRRAAALEDERLASKTFPREVEEACAEKHKPLWNRLGIRGRRRLMDAYQQSKLSA